MRLRLVPLPVQGLARVAPAEEISVPADREVALACAGVVRGRGEGVSPRDRGRCRLAYRRAGTAADGAWADRTSNTVLSGSGTRDLRRVSPRVAPGRARERSRVPPYRVGRAIGRIARSRRGNRVRGEERRADRRPRTLVTEPHGQIQPGVDPAPPSRDARAGERAANRGVSHKPSRFMRRTRFRPDDRRRGLRPAASSRLHLCSVIVRLGVEREMAVEGCAADAECAGDLGHRVLLRSHRLSGSKLLGRHEARAA